MSASHVYSRDGYRYTSILYGSDNDNSSSDRDKNLQLTGDIIRRKYPI